jgi:uncharacterized repeat protein (TIGR04138 family)
MQATSFDEVLDQILAQEKRYSRDAYVFLREALDHTQKLVGKGKGLRHVSGQELLNGIRDYALDQFGPMSVTVFEEWGIHSCKDFGEMVFILVENGLLAKTDRDTREDFENGYGFYDTFRKPFLPKGKLHKSVLQTKSTRA